MKRSIVLLIAMALSCAVSAQGLTGFNYQAVARNLNGTTLSNKDVTVRFTITQGNTNLVLYQETQNAVTNSYGLFNLVIGKGTPVAGTFAAVPWINANQWLQVEVATGGGPFNVLGKTALFASPYAIVAGSANPAGPAGGDLTGTYPNPTLVPSGAVAGLYGSATTYPVVNVDAKGRVTSVAQLALPTTLPPSGPAGGDLSGTYPNPVLAASGVVAGTYGGATTYPVVNIDAKGRVTTASQLALPLTLPPSGAAGGDLSGTYPNPTLNIPFTKSLSQTANALFSLTNTATTGTTGAIAASSASTDGNATAIQGTISSTAPGGFSAAVRGINNGTGGLGIGVWGSQNGSGWGVYGTATAGVGVNGTTSTGIGVNGTTSTGTAGRFSGGTGLALFTTGALRLQGIGEAAGRVLTTDATGNATWQPVSAASGTVSGSGTLNYVSKWTPSGSQIGISQLFDDGNNVGINTATPTYKLDVIHAGATGIRSRSTGSFSVVDIDANSGDAAMRFQKNGTGMWNTRNRPADDAYEWFELGGGGSRMIIQRATGNVGVGETANPSYRLDVLHGGATGIRSRSSASFSVVDIDAASGDAALRFANAGVNQWNTRNRPADNYYEIFELGGGGSRFVIQDGTGNVGIGESANPTYKLDVLHTGSTGIRSRSSASFSVVDIDAFSGDAALRFANNGVNQWNERNNPSNNDLQFFELGGGGERLAIKDGTGNIAIGGSAGTYKLDVLHGGSTGILSKSSASFSVVDIDAFSGDAALRFANNGVNQWNQRNNPSNNDLQFFELGGGGERLAIKDGTGNIAIGGSTGSYKLDILHGGATGILNKSTSSFSVVDIDAFTGDAALRFANNGVNQWNIRNQPGTNNLQVFELGGGGERMRIDNTTGKVWVNADFTALGVKAFTMDHPLDPENKLLMHAAAESNEVINIYSGNIVTDANGKAVVQLPAYFDAINKDPRYQLTVIGSFAQAIISKEESNNSFEIATSQPNVKVSWEVKGVRNDAHMRKTPFVAEQNKPAADRGKYYDPAAHNQPQTKGVGYDGNLSSSISPENNKPKQAAAIAAPAIKGTSLEQITAVKPVVKAAAPSGSTADTPAAKPVEKTTPDNSGSVAPQPKPEAKKTPVKIPGSQSTD